jgi:O-6-methylguanine DNA methyltransferase
MMDSNKVLEKLDSYGLTHFQKRVLIATFSIPKGETRTYKEIASMVGRPNAYRAVGTVLKNNPMAPIIPCHRVIRSDGSIGNYSGAGGRSRKRMFLKAEGAL